MPEKHGNHGLLKKLTLSVSGILLGLLSSKKSRHFLRKKANQAVHFSHSKHTSLGKQTPRVARFLRGQRRELGELASGQETFSRFLHDSADLLGDLFIPSDANGYKPRALRPKSLLFYAFLAVGVKVVITAFLFLSYPSPAVLSEITTAGIFRMINVSREADGLEPLSLNPILSEAASTKGADMLARQYFAHDTPDGKRPWEWINREQYDYVVAGENLAMGFITAEAAHQALMQSPTHRKNILNGRYSDIGLAVIEGELNGLHTQLLVQFFGTQRSTLAAATAQQPTAPAPAQPTVAPAQPAAPAVTPEPEPSQTVASVTQPEPEPIRAVEPVPAAEPAILPAVQPSIQPVLPVENLSQIARTLGETVSAANPTPEDVLAEGSSGSPIIVVNSGTRHKPFAAAVIEYSNIFFVGFLIFLLLSLALNVFIKIHIQDPAVIFQTLVLIALVASMALVKLHFLEQFVPQLLLV